jgi:hypothetical protein
VFVVGVLVLETTKINMEQYMNKTYCSLIDHKTESISLFPVSDFCRLVCHQYSFVSFVRSPPCFLGII